MPKKFKGENSKAVVARARKSAQLEEQREMKQRAEEDEYWKDDDKHVNRKQQRKEEREKKRIEHLDKKKEAQELLEVETAGLKSAKAPPPAKVTRAKIAAHKEHEAEEAKKAAAVTPVTEQPLMENVNRTEASVGARSVEEAIAMLSVDEPAAEKHPEKRVKAAYNKYEEENLPILKAENPNMRLSQLKQMLRKDWQKSSDNPLNQRHMAYNAKSK